MPNSYFLLPLVTWVISQSLKYLLRVIHDKGTSRKHAQYIYLFASGMPSSHTAVLCASLLLIGFTEGFNSGFFFIFLVFSCFWLYEIFMQRKRYQALIQIFKESTDHIHQEALRDLNGHDLKDIIGGCLVGLSIFLIFVIIAQ